MRATLDRQEAVARARPVVPVRSGAPAARLLALQRMAGNRAATALVQRACCGGCASGGPCEDERAAPGAGRPQGAQRAQEERAEEQPAVQRMPAYSPNPSW